MLPFPGLHHASEFRGHLSGRGSTTPNTTILFPTCSPPGMGPLKGTAWTQEESVLQTGSDKIRVCVFGLSYQASVCCRLLPLLWDHPLLEGGGEEEGGSVPGAHWVNLAHWV